MNARELNVRRTFLPALHVIWQVEPEARPARHVPAAPFVTTALLEQSPARSDYKTKCNACKTLHSELDDSPSHEQEEKRSTRETTTRAGAGEAGVAATKQKLTVAARLHREQEVRRIVLKTET